MQGKPHFNSTFPAKQQSFSIGKAVFAGKHTAFSSSCSDYPLEQVAEQNRLSSTTQVRLLDNASQLFAHYLPLIRAR